MGLALCKEINATLATAVLYYLIQFRAWHQDSLPGIATIQFYLVPERKAVQKQ